MWSYINFFKLLHQRTMFLNFAVCLIALVPISDQKVSVHFLLQSC